MDTEEINSRVESLGLRVQAFCFGVGSEGIVLSLIVGGNRVDSTLRETVKGNLEKSLVEFSKRRVSWTIEG